MCYHNSFTFPHSGISFSLPLKLFVHFLGSLFCNFILFPNSLVSKSVPIIKCIAVTIFQHQTNKQSTSNNSRTLRHFLSFSLTAIKWTKYMTRHKSKTKQSIITTMHFSFTSPSGCFCSALVLKKGAPIICSVCSHPSHIPTRRSP